MNKTTFETNNTANDKSFSAEQLVQYLNSTGIINLDDVKNSMKKAEKEQIISEHPHPITLGRDGRWRTYIRRKDGTRKQIAKSSYEKVVDALVDYYKTEDEEEQPATLEILYPEWLEYRKLHNIAPTYIQRINSDWKNHYEGTAIVKKPVDQLDKYALDVWAHQLIQKIGNGKKQYYNISMIMRQMLDYAVDRKIIKENPFNEVRIDSRRVFDPVRKKSSETQVFTKKELEALKEVAKKEYMEGHNAVHKLAPLAIMFQFQTGVRAGELCALRYEDIEGDEIYVNRMYRYATKEVVSYLKGHNTGRYVCLTDEAKKIIATAKKFQKENGLSDDGYIFSVNQDPLSYYTIKKSYARYCDLIGTVHKSSHKARKTFISALIDGGVNIDTIRESVGHNDERTTFKSYCYDRRTKSERAELIKKALS